MKLEQEYMYDDRGLKLKGTRLSDMRVVAKTFAENYSDTRYKKVLVYVWDYRNVDLSPITADEMKSNIVESTKFRTKWNDTCPSVMVTETDLQFDLSRIQHLMDAEKIAFEFHTVRLMKEAFSWVDGYLEHVEA